MEYPNSIKVEAVRIVEHIISFLALAEMSDERAVKIAVGKLKNCFDHTEEFKDHDEILGKIILYLEKISEESS